MRQLLRRLTSASRRNSAARAKPAAKPKAAQSPEARARSVRRRMLVVGVGLALGISVAVGRALVLQTHYHEQLKREAAANYVRHPALDNWRGDVRDRNGSLLALTVHRWAVTIDPQLVSHPEETAALLARLLEMRPGKIAAKLGAGAVDEETSAFSWNPAALAAREAIDPAMRVLSDMFQYPMDRLNRRLEMVAHFYQLEQLQVPGIHRIAEVLATASETLADVLSASPSELQFLGHRGRRFAYIARNVDDTMAGRVEGTKQRLNEICREARRSGEKCHNPLSAVRIASEPRRYYPKREVATQVLGLVGPDNHGLAGVELALDGWLSGGQHRARAVRDRRGRSLYLGGLPSDSPLGAISVELSIDERVQAFTEQAISEACQVAGARAGYIVVMKVKTGEILAAANYPSYNPNSYQQWFRDRQPLLDERRAFARLEDDLKWAAESPMVNRAFPGSWKEVARDVHGALGQQYDAFVEYAHAHPDATRAAAFLDVYEPGSIAKVFTAAAGLEEGVISLSDVLDLENGELALHDPEDTRIRDTSRYESGNLAFIIKKSSNIGASKIGFILGAERLERYLRAFGFGAPSGTSFPGEAAGLLYPSSKWTIVHLANIAFGQGFAATGVQLAAGLSALGNGGKLMRPVLVKRITDSEGQVIREWQPEVVRQVVSEKTASTVLDLMRGVVEPDGTGPKAYIPEYPVAGKTGTGQKSHLRKRGYAEDMWVATFFGVAPADDPELAVVVLVDEPKAKRHYGGVFAAPAFKRVMRWTLRYLSVPSPYDTGKRVAYVEPDELERRRKPQPKDDVDARLAALGPPVDPNRTGDLPVPDFRGLTMDRVRQLAHKSGLLVRYVGTGVAVDQDIPVHQRVPAWSTITIRLAKRDSGTPVPAPGPVQAGGAQ